MANTKSALKRVRQAEIATARNKSITSRMKNFRKQAITAAEAGDKDAATKAFSEFSSAVDLCAKKKIIHKNKAANLKSKTNKHLKA